MYKHIILISLDTLRADCITAFGKSRFVRDYSQQASFETSALNDLIFRGVFYENCITAAPYTTAAHAAYFTGCWPKKNGVYEFFNRRLASPTIFELSKIAGFKTIFQTDFPVILGQSIGFTKGIDKYYIEDEWKAFDQLKAWENQETLSFFHFGGIHYPYGFHKIKFAPDDYPEKVNELEKKFNISKNITTSDILDESFRNSQDKRMLFRYKNILDKLYADKKYDTLHALYIEGVDYFFKHRFNKFLIKLKEFVDQNNALLVIFSDHGEEWGKTSRGHSNSIAHSVLRVPLIFYSRSIKQNKLSSLVRTIDVMPTLANLAGITIPDVDGKILPISEEKTPKRLAFAQVWRVGNKLKVYDHQQKILKSKRIVKPLKTNLEKEVVYFDKYIFQRMITSKNISEVFYNNGVETISRVSPTKMQLMKSRNYLKEYNNNSLRSSRIEKVSKIISDELHLLGYNI